MKKDYIPVPPEQIELTEIKRVEQQWTSVWQGREADPVTLAKKITQREEYRMMKPYLEQIRSTKKLRILDAGCGQGEWTIYLADQGDQVYGVDISRQTIELLNQKFPQYNFLCADIRHLEFTDNLFDAYFSWGTFEHFEDGLGKCITEAWRVLQPGGFLFISVPFQNWRHIMRDALPWQRSPTYTTPMRFYQWRLTQSELHHELAMRGFQVLEIKRICKIQGLGRALEHDLRIPSRSLIGRVAKHLLKPIVPSRWVSHMLMAVAQKK